MARIGWRFPPTGGGQSDGYNNPGMAHFRGAPLASLARETIQNSLDARMSGEDSVQIEFELRKVLGKDALARLELGTIVDQCLATSHTDPKAEEELGRAKEILNKPQLTFLRIVDRHTTGLQGENWNALIKWQGTSVKEMQGAGGSFGIGKYAPFVVSSLRTVFYWSRFEHEGKTVEQFQGKAVLMSHLDENDEETQGVGFYGLVEGCKHLTYPDIPEEIQEVEGRAINNGTSLWIAGFDDDAGWQKRIARSVIENFFCAIDDRQLSVLIEPDDDMECQGLMEINADTLDMWFDYLLPPGCDIEDENEALAEAQAFREILRTNPVSKEKHDEDLGDCKLWIAVGEHLPSRVALIRQTGMLITSQQAQLQRFPNTRPFGAVCRFDSEVGNELLRQMENPEHNQFKPDFLPESDRDRGRRALGRIVKWIREEIKTQVAPQTSNKSSVISELANFLPDIEPDDAFRPDENGDDREPALKGDPIIRIKPRRKRATETESEQDSQTEGIEGDGVEMGSEGGGGEEDNQGDGGERGGGDGNADGGRGNRGGNEGRTTAVPIVNVRYLPIPEKQQRCRISFTPKKDANQASIHVAEAGDSAFFSRHDLEVVTGNKKVKLSDHRIDLVANRRYEFEVASVQPTDGRAWRIQVKKPEN